MKTKSLSAIVSLVLCAAQAPQTLAQPSDVKIDRTVLPIAEPNYPRSKVPDARDAKPPSRFEIKSTAGVPNVLIVLVDDMGGITEIATAFSGSTGQRPDNIAGVKTSGGAGAVAWDTRNSQAVVVAAGGGVDK